MTELHPLISLDQLHSQATEKRRSDLADARLEVAREYGFDTWDELTTEVERRAILSACDLMRLDALLAARPGLATQPMRRWCDHRGGPRPLGFVAMLRYDTVTGAWRDVPGTGAVARRLLRAGALVDGAPGEPETPLMTAASYGDADVAQALIEAGADLEATAAANAGGVPGGTALRHAGVFGMTEVVDVLVAAGALIHSLGDAATAGDIADWLHPGTPEPERIGALVAAVDHERLTVIDQFLAVGTPIDAADPWDRRPLHQAVAGGKVASVRLLLDRGADATVRDSRGLSAVDHCHANHPLGTPARAQLDVLLSQVAEPPAEAEAADGTPGA